MLGAESSAVTSELEWLAFLDALELRLSHYEALLTHGKIPPPYELPRFSGALPAFLHERAREIATRQEAIETLLLDQLDALALVLDAHQHPGFCAYLDEVV